MYNPFTYLVVAYFLTYLPIFQTYFLQKWLPRWNQILTQLRFIHNWVITGTNGWCTGGCWVTVAHSLKWMPLSQLWIQEKDWHGSNPSATTQCIECGCQYIQFEQQMLSKTSVYPVWTRHIIQHWDSYHQNLYDHPCQSPHSLDCPLC
jgi:hypothetical protein